MIWNLFLKLPLLATVAMDTGWSSYYSGMAVTPLDLRHSGRDDTLSVSFRGFPVRSLTRNVHGQGSGEWVLAYEMHQKHRLKLTIGLSDSSHSTTNGSITVPGNTPSNGSAHTSRHSLDKKLLLKQGYVDHPSDLCTVDISGLELSNYKETDFFLFTILRSINASDNQLSLEAFQSLPAIEELQLSLNGIVNIDIMDKSFEFLSILDLSYNYLSETSITDLGRLPQLTELHLTGNSIVTLPNNMSRPHRVQTNNEKSEVRVSFQKLEKIWLDDNKLCDPTTFAILAGLRRLNYLNLDNNELTNIPHLKLLGTAGLLQDHTQEGDNTTPSTSKADDSNRSTSENNTQQLSKLSSQSFAPFPQLHTISLCNNMILSGSSLLPCSSWPVLKELIIIGNPLVSMHKGLPEVLQSELTDKCNIDVIRIKQDNKGKRRSLEKKLKEMRKVSLTPPPLIPKQPILLAIEAPLNNDNDEDGHRTSPLYLTNEFPDSDNEDDRFSTQQHSMISDQPQNQHQGSNTTATTNNGVFLTEFNQVNDDDTALPPAADGSQQVQNGSTSNNRATSNNGDSNNDKGRNSDQSSLIPCDKNDDVKKIPTVTEIFNQRRKTEKEKFCDIPNKFKGFESLLNDEEDQDMYYDAPPLPTGQHSCSKVLKYALDHPLLADHTEKKKNSKNKREVPVAVTLGTTGDYLKTKPIKEQYHNVPAVSSRKQKVSGLIQELQEHQTSIEVNLKDVLDQKDLMKRITTSDKKHTEVNNNDDMSLSMDDESTSTMIKREGKQLLTKLQTKYDKIREVSLETIAAIDSAQSIAKVGSRKPSKRSIS